MRVCVTFLRPTPNGGAHAGAVFLAWPARPSREALHAYLDQRGLYPRTVDGPVTCIAIEADAFPEEIPNDVLLTAAQLREYGLLTPNEWSAARAGGAQ